ncbi:hypothetical protein IMSAGC014_02009 [Bacteroidaceae bacterium]|nr:hypothetical protein IMSAGC014_02009 [Bacteroidaceae bacterium]
MQAVLYVFQTCSAGVTGCVDKAVQHHGVSVFISVLFGEATTEGVNLAYFRIYESFLEVFNGGFKACNLSFDFFECHEGAVFFGFSHLSLYSLNCSVGFGLGCGGEHTDFGFFADHAGCYVRFELVLNFAQSCGNFIGIGKFLEEVVVGLLEVVDDFAGSLAFIMGLHGNCQIVGQSSADGFAYRGEGQRGLFVKLTAINAEFGQCEVGYSVLVVGRAEDAFGVYAHGAYNLHADMAVRSTEVKTGHAAGILNDRVFDNNFTGEVAERIVLGIVGSHVVLECVNAFVVPLAGSGSRVVGSVDVDLSGREVFVSPVAAGIFEDNCLQFFAEVDVEVVEVTVVNNA